VEWLETVIKGIVAWLISYYEEWIVRRRLRVVESLLFCEGSDPLSSLLWLFFFLDRDRQARKLALGFMPGGGRFSC